MLQVELKRNLGKTIEEEKPQFTNTDSGLNTSSTTNNAFVTGALCSGLIKHEGALYKEVFPGKIEAHLLVTVKVRGSNSKWRAI